ncbi:HRDC domain-containing protein [Alloscardovia macacae]|uniref:Ribonuclease D n=1 Tax=Alloscardovia macacae TaxID=1160091 RepID=A0A261F5I2_9BIFI|nr:HRDC domain-containing protein [Alloscardovia macacae]OZG54364.1 ribonuclease D [Alloscardovia macacae]
MSESIADIRLLAEPAGGVPDVVETRQQFDTFIHHYEASDGPVAADAERASGYRYGHRDFLVQLKREGAPIALLDIEALKDERVDWNAFNRLVTGEPWIIHDSLQDLPGFTDIGLKVDSLFDTEMAARLLGATRFGLSSVTEKYLGVTLAKEHSGSDWSYRPLNRDMRNYAALDVEVLIELRSILITELKKAGKWDWALEEFEHLLEKGTAVADPHPQPWRRVSHITEVNADPRALAVVKELWETREKLAEELDIAPTLLLEDASIIEAAKRKPRNARQFRAIRRLNERVRVQTSDDERNKMYERYASVQRNVKPKAWKEAIDRALAMPMAQVASEVELVGGEKRQQGSSPRSMKQWKEHHPERYARLTKARELIGQVSQDTHTPVEVLMKPQYIRNLCWQADADYSVSGIEEFLAEQGARNWQVSLLAPSLSKVII